jgi:hypothetical protein
MKPLKSFVTFGLFILFAFFLAGCFEYEETITIRKDGSGEMAVHYFGPTDSDINLDGFKLGAKDYREMREQIERKFNGAYTRVKSYDSRVKNDQQHVYFTVTFDQFANLAKVRWWDDHNIDAGQRAGQNFWKRTWRDRNRDEDEKNSGFGEWLKEKIADELEDHIKLRFVVETDGEIVETNAPDHMPHRAVWRFDGGDLLKPEGLDMRLAWK